MRTVYKTDLTDVQKAGKRGKTELAPSFVQVAAAVAAAVVGAKLPAAAAFAAEFLSGVGVPAPSAFVLPLRAVVGLLPLPCAAGFLQPDALPPLPHAPTWQPPLPSQKIHKYVKSKWL